MNYVKKRHLCLSLIISLTSVLNFVHVNFTSTVVFQSPLINLQSVDTMRFDSLYNSLVCKLQRKLNVTLCTTVVPARKMAEAQVEAADDEEVIIEQNSDNVKRISLFDLQRLYKLVSLSFLLMKPFVVISSENRIEDQPVPCLRKGIRYGVSCINTFFEQFPCQGVTQNLALAHCTNCAALIIEQGSGYCALPCVQGVAFGGSCCVGCLGGYGYGYSQDDAEVNACGNNCLPSYVSNQTYISVLSYYPVMPVAATGVHVGVLAGYNVGRFHDLAEKHGYSQACSMTQKSCMQCPLQAYSAVKQSCLSVLTRSELNEQQGNAVDRSVFSINRFFQGCPGWVQPLVTSDCTNMIGVGLKCGPKLCGCPCSGPVSGALSCSLGLLTGYLTRTSRNKPETTAFFESFTTGLNSDTSWYDTNLFAVIGNHQKIPYTTIGINAGNVVGGCIAAVYDKFYRPSKIEKPVLSKVDTTLLVQYLQHRQHKILEEEQKELMKYNRESKNSALLTLDSISISSTPLPAHTTRKPVLERLDKEHKNLLERHLQAKIALGAREEK